MQVTDLVWMSHADCVRVARAVFLDTATLYYRDLIDTVESQASGGQKQKGVPSARLSADNKISVVARIPLQPKCLSEMRC